MLFDWIFNLLPDVQTLLVAIVAFALSLIAMQMVVNHELRNRENALQELAKFDKMRTKDLNRSIFFVFDLTAEQKRKVLSMETFRVDRQLLTQFFPEMVSKRKEGLIELPFEFVVELRFTIVTMLNTIESLALSYKHGVADRSILKEAFFHPFITDNRLGKWVDLMKETGDPSWPVIEELSQLIKPIRDSAAIYPAKSILQMIGQLVVRLFKPVTAS